MIEVSSLGYRLAIQTIKLVYAKSHSVVQYRTDNCGCVRHSLGDSFPCFRGIHPKYRTICSLAGLREMKAATATVKSNYQSSRDMGYVGILESVSLSRVVG